QISRGDLEIAEMRARGRTVDRACARLGWILHQRDEDVAVVAIDPRYLDAEFEPIGQADAAGYGRRQYVLPAFVDVEHADQHRLRDLDAAEHEAVAIRAGIFDARLDRHPALLGQHAAPFREHRDLLDGAALDRLDAHGFGGLAGGRGRSGGRGRERWRRRL